MLVQTKGERGVDVPVLAEDCPIAAFVAPKSGVAAAERLVTEVTDSLGDCDYLPGLREAGGSL